MTTKHKIIALASTTFTLLLTVSLAKNTQIEDLERSDIALVIVSSIFNLLVMILAHAATKSDE